MGCRLARPYRTLLANRRRSARHQHSILRGIGCLGFCAAIPAPVDAVVRGAERRRVRSHLLAAMETPPAEWLARNFGNRRQPGRQYFRRISEWENYAGGRRRLPGPVPDEAKTK